MNLESRKRRVEYSMAKDVMFEHTDPQGDAVAGVNVDKKKRARLNCIRIVRDIYRGASPEGHAPLNLLHFRPLPAPRAAAMFRPGGPTDGPQT